MNHMHDIILRIIYMVESTNRGIPTHSNLQGGA